MNLTKEQQSLLDGSKGETMAKVVKTLVMYGEAFDAERMVPVAEGFGHTVISFGIGVMTPVYDLYEKLLSAGAVSGQTVSYTHLPRKSAFSMTPASASASPTPTRATMPRSSLRTTRSPRRSL